MATIGNGLLTVADKLKALDPDLKQAKIIEKLAERNDILTDMPWLEGNLPTGHRTTTRSSYPQGTWRRLYGGVAPSKGTITQVDDTAGELVSYSKIDKSLFEINGNSNEYRMQEDMAHVEGMRQTVAENIFYGNSNTNPERFLGLHDRFNALGGTVGDASYQVVDGGGSGSDNTSIWFIQWGDESVHGFYPKGTKGGLDINDRGQQTVHDDNGNPYEAMMTHFRWMCGLSLRNPRAVARIANIDVSDLADAGTSSYAGAELINLMISAQHKLQFMDKQTVIYMNRTAHAALDKLAQSKDNLSLSHTEYAGQLVTTFRNIPLRVCDAIMDSEETIA